MHLFFFNNRIKSEETNHQHFLWKNDDYAKTKKENKNRRRVFRGKLSDNKLVKFQPNGFRGCRLGVKNVRLTFPNFRSEKKRKIYFLRHLTRNRIITLKRPCWCLPERDHLAWSPPIARKPRTGARFIANALRSSHRFVDLLLQSFTGYDSVAMEEGDMGICGVAVLMFF